MRSLSRPESAGRIGLNAADWLLPALPLFVDLSRHRQDSFDMFRTKPFRFAAFAIATCLTVVTTAEAQLTLARAPRQLGRTIPSATELAAHGLEKQWWAQAGFDPTSDKLKSITADEDNVYVVSDRGSITAFDAESGERLWVVLLGSDIAPVLQPVSNSKQVLTAAGTMLVAINKFEGDIEWQFRLRGQPATAPSVDDSNVYVGTLDGKVYAYNLRQVKQLFDDGKMPEYSYNAQVWTYRAPSAVSSPPGTTGSTVDFASRSGIFTAVSASDRRLQFLFETDGEIVAPVARTEKYAIIPSTDRNVYCINSRNGQVQWTFASGLPVFEQPTVVNGRVFIEPKTLGLFQLDLTTGRRQWTQPLAKTFLSSTPEYVYAVDSLDNLLKLSAKNGQLVTTLPLNGYRFHVSNNRTDRIFMATSTGLVLSMREANRAFPIYHRYPERRPLLPTFAPDVPVEPSGDADSDAGA